MTASYRPIVLDTNLLVSAILNPAGHAAQVLDIASAHFEVVASRETFGELAEVLGRRKFDSYAPAAIRKQFVEDYAALVKMVTVDQAVTACKDPKDNKFLALAVEVGAAVLVTGDKRDLLSMNAFQGVSILGLRVFAEQYLRFK
jgi:uncharacterized protein